MAAENQKKYRYPGIKSFETNEKEIFFGRDEDTRALYELIGIEKTVLLYSKSGLGKTSLINAGLIPKLNEDRDKRYQPFVFRFNVYTKANMISPKERIIEALRKASSTGSFREQYPELYENSLMYWIKGLQLINPGKVQVLIFDQFEELFTYPVEKVNELKQELHDLVYMKLSARFRESILGLPESGPGSVTGEQAEILSSAVNIRLLFSIRSDRLSLLNDLTDYLPGLFRTFYELKPLTEEKAIEAIEKPAKSDGEFECPKFEFQPFATRKILSILSGKGRQPIQPFQLQLICHDLELKVIDKRQDSIITPDDLDNLPDILKNFIERILGEIQTESEAERKRLRELLEEKFIVHQEKRRFPVLKGVILNYISEPTLASLEKTHLVRSEPYEDTYTYELTHDNLVEPFLESYQKRKFEEEQAVREAAARKAQLEKEEKERKEKALREQEEKSNREKEELRKKAIMQRKRITLISVAGIFCLFFGLWGFYNMSRANKETQNANKLSDSLMVEKKNRDSLEVKLKTQSLINDAKSYAMYGYLEDALRYADSAIKIDANNREADSLINLYRNR